MNSALQHTDRRDEVEVIERPVSVSHLVHIIRAYASVILLGMLSVAVGYTLIAVVLYILSPAQRTTVQPFRLEFRGATEGNLPNGVRFSPSEIVSTPVLLKVYEIDELKHFINFSDFSHSVFVLESNREYERLLSEYSARLADPRLLPLDRDRIQKEFDAKRASIAKSDFAISFARTSNSVVPNTLVRKVLNDILNTWAAFAINEQHALDYRVAVLSPQILDQAEIGSNDPIITIEILRSKIYRVIDNIEELNKLPAAELMKTSDRMSLAEIRMRLEDIVRFRLEPLVGVARASGLVPQPLVTIHFLENQLAYDQRRLAAAHAVVKTTRDMMAMYSGERAPTDTASLAAVASRLPGNKGSEGGEAVMPQLTDTFLDKLVALTRQASDSDYRQRLIKEYRDAVGATIPIEQTVSYEQQVLEQMKSGTAPAAPRSDEATVRAEIQNGTAETRRLIIKVNEIYQLLSRNLNPSTQLFSLTGPPASRIERARTLSRLMLYGVVLLLVALPVIVLLCLLHNRVREEEAAERLMTTSPEPA